MPSHVSSGTVTCREHWILGLNLAISPGIFLPLSLQVGFGTVPALWMQTLLLFVSISLSTWWSLRFVFVELIQCCPYKGKRTCQPGTVCGVSLMPSGINSFLKKVIILFVNGRRPCSVLHSLGALLRLFEKYLRLFWKKSIAGSSRDQPVYTTFQHWS